MLFRSTGKINAKFEDKGLHIIAQKRLHLTRDQAEKFYAVHKDRPFFKDLVSFMISGPVVVQVLEGPDAVALENWSHKICEAIRKQVGG